MAATRDALAAVMLLALAACGYVATPMPTPTFQPTATIPPTAAPGSAADEREVADTVRQFAQAVVRGETIVALVVLSPSAQRVVASSDLQQFLGRTERPRTIQLRDVQLDEDVARADCAIWDSSGEHSIQLRLVRIDGEWKIDARNDD
jgi:hypothetical protein